jgi:hypothetical protein
MYFLYSYASGKFKHTGFILADISYFEALFLKGRMNISDNLYKLRISYGMYFIHYKQKTCFSHI